MVPAQDHPDQARGDEGLPERAEAVLRFWFGEQAGRTGNIPSAKQQMWWQGDAETDALIRESWLALWNEAADGGLDHWARFPEGRLALILLLDQFSRHIHRGHGYAYLQDERAQLLCLAGLDRQSHRSLSRIQRVFFYMPLEHAEDSTLQERSVHLYEELLEEAPTDEVDAYRTYLEFARSHREVIARFGRFPHRNAELGRETTPEEAAFLRTQGRGF